MPNMSTSDRPRNRGIDINRHQSLETETQYNSDGMPYQRVKLYNGTGGALVKNRPYRMTFAGTSTTVQNPRVAALAALAAVDQQVVIADEAVADASWGWFCFQGYHDVGMEGTADITAGDFLKCVAATSTTGLITDTTTRTVNSIAMALEGQTAAGVVDKRCYLLGDRAVLT